MEDYMDIWFACREGLLGKVKKYVEDGVDLNDIDRYGNTPAYYCCLCGHPDILRYLIQKGAYVNIRTIEGERCYLGALTEEIRSILLSQLKTYGNQPIPKSQRKLIAVDKSPAPKQSLIRIAIIKGDLERIENWIDDGFVDVISTLDSYNFSLLEMAVMTNQPKIANLLMENGAPTTFRLQQHYLLKQTQDMAMIEATNHKSSLSGSSMSYDLILSVDTHKIYLHSVILMCRCRGVIEDLIKISKSLESYSPTSTSYRNDLHDFWLSFGSYCGLKSDPVEISVGFLCDLLQEKPYEVYQALLALFDFYYSENVFIPNKQYSILSKLAITSVFNNREPNNVKPSHDDGRLELLDFSPLLFFKQGTVAEVEDTELAELPIQRRSMRITLNKDMYYGVNNPIASDIIFSVEGKPVFAHKCILAKNEYFRALLYGGMKGSNSCHVNIENISYSAFIHLMEFFYTDNVYHFDATIDPQHVLQKWEGRERTEKRNLSLTEMCINAILQNISKSLFGEDDTSDIEPANGTDHDNYIQRFLNTSLFSSRFFQFGRNEELEFPLSEEYRVKLIELAIELIQISEEYFLPKLSILSEKFLLRFYQPTISDVVDVYLMAKGYKCSDLTAMCESLIIKRCGIIAFEKEEEWMKLDESIRKKFTVRSWSRSVEEREAEKNEIDKLQKARERKKREEERKLMSKNANNKNDSKPVAKAPSLDFVEEIVFAKEVHGKSNKKKNGKRR